MFAVQVGSLALQIVHRRPSSSSLELSEPCRNREGNWRWRLGQGRLDSLLESCSLNEEAFIIGASDSELESEFAAGGSGLWRAVGFFRVCAAG